MRQSPITFKNHYKENIENKKNNSFQKKRPQSGSDLSHTNNVAPALPDDHLQKADSFG